MANEKVSQLASGNPAQSADLLLMARSGTSFSVTAGSVAALAGTVTHTGTLTSNAVILGNSGADVKPGAVLPGDATKFYDGTGAFSTPSGGGSSFNVVTNASGSIVTTTGTISVGTNLLTVASTVGWAIGMGIAVANAGTGGNTDLITTITNIVGSVFTLTDNAIATATTQTVYHDDTAAIAAAIATGGPVYIPKGNYNITSELTISGPIKIEGSGPGTTILWVRYANVLNGIFTINYQIAGGATTVTGKGCVIRDLEISQSAGITPTHGFAFVVNSSSGTGFYTVGVHIENIHINNLYGGIFVGNNQISNWFRDIYIVDPVQYGIYYDTPVPGGDDHFQNIEMTGSAAGLTIIHSDTTEFHNLKINGSQITFAAPSSATEITRVRFTDVSVEGSPTQSVDFGTHGCTQVQFIGGTLANGTLTNQANAVGLQFIGTNIGNVSVASVVGAGPVPTSYTPTVTAFSGTFTSVSATGRYYQLGKMVFFTVVITSTTVGSASVATQFTLPVAASATSTNKHAFTGVEIVNTGKQFRGAVDPTTSTSFAACKQYDNTFGLTDGSVIVMTGFYEAA